MRNETIEAAWNELRDKVQPLVDDQILALMQRAFYSGSYSTAIRILAAANVSSAQFSETINDIQAEFAEHAQRVKDSHR